MVFNKRRYNNVINDVIISNKLIQYDTLILVKVHSRYIVFIKYIIY